MAIKRKQLPLLKNILVTDIAAEGKAIAKVDGLAIFVPYVLPGDIVDIQLIRKRANYAEGRVVEFHSYSENRAEPFCQHFTVCGGCKWQNLPYKEQLKQKQKQVLDSMQRLGKIEITEVFEIMPAPETTHYRNKLEFTFSNRRWLTKEEIAEDVTLKQIDGLGFHIPGMFDKVVDIEKCWLMEELSNSIRDAVRQFCLDNQYAFFDIRKQSGLMRNLIIRNSSIGEWMVILVFFEENREKRERLMEHIATEFPQITSLLYIVNQKANDSIADQEPILWSGRDHIFEEMGGLRFKIGAKSFFQTNSRQAYNLYKVVRSFAQLTGVETVYDLYTGTGTIANFIASDAKKVIGVEYMKEAIEDAKINSALNGINNTLFFAGDMKDILNSRFISEQGEADVIITDPPRAGMHNDVINTIISAEPQRIVYVSCNPSTQARDLSLLDSHYSVARMQPLDMFPHTHHLENVVLLEKRK